MKLIFELPKKSHFRNFGTSNPLSDQRVDFLEKQRPPSSSEGSFTPIKCRKESFRVYNFLASPKNHPKLIVQMEQYLSFWTTLRACWRAKFDSSRYSFTRIASNRSFILFTIVRFYDLSHGHSHYSLFQKSYFFERKWELRLNWRLELRNIFTITANSIKISLLMIKSNRN